MVYSDRYDGGFSKDHNKRYYDTPSGRHDSSGGRHDSYGGRHDSYGGRHDSYGGRHGHHGLLRSDHGMRSQYDRHSRKLKEDFENYKSINENRQDKRSLMKKLVSHKDSLDHNKKSVLGKLKPHAAKQNSKHQSNQDEIGSSKKAKALVPKTEPSPVPTLADKVSKADSVNMTKMIKNEQKAQTKATSDLVKSLKQVLPKGATSQIQQKAKMNATALATNITPVKVAAAPAVKTSEPPTTTQSSTKKIPSSVGNEIAMDPISEISAALNPSDVQKATQSGAVQSVKTVATVQKAAAQKKVVSGITINASTLQGPILAAKSAEKEISLAVKKAANLTPAPVPKPTPAPTPAPAPTSTPTPTITNAQAISAFQSQLKARMENVTYRNIAVAATASALTGNVKPQMSMLTGGARNNVGKQISTLLSEGKITQQQANTFRSNMGLTASAPSPTPTSTAAPLSVTVAPTPTPAATPTITNAQAISALKSQLNAKMENVMYRSIAVNATGSALTGNVKAPMSMLTSGARNNVGKQISTLLTEGKITQQQASTFEKNMGVS